MSDTQSNQGDPIPKIGVYQGDRNEQFIRHGKGHNQFPNGDQYTGSYSLGIREGNGVYKWKSTNARYVGEYSQGKRHGYGVMIYPDGSKYSGCFLEGVKSGKGEYLYSNGDVFLGEFLADVKHGAGVYTYTSLNVKKCGLWYENQLQSAGEIQYPNATIDVVFQDNDTVVGRVNIRVPMLGGHSIENQSPQQFGLKVQEQ